jgi:hypothetical protein
VYGWLGLVGGGSWTQGWEPGGPSKVEGPEREKLERSIAERCWFGFGPREDEVGPPCE